MSTRTDAPTDLAAPARAPLSKERVLRAAIDLADTGGIESLSMRKLGQALGVEAMSLYNHARNKDDILDGIVDVIIGEIDPGQLAADWQPALRQTILAARAVLLRHPWGPRVIETRTNPGPAMLRHVDTVFGILRAGGFSIDMTHHAIHVLGSRIFGFTQDPWVMSGGTPPTPEVAALIAHEMGERYPHVTEMAMAVSHDGGLGGCDDDVEFAFGLDLILDGFERLRVPIDGTPAASPPP
jgi:AcrR family transcriptional regulator